MSRRPKVFGTCRCAAVRQGFWHARVNHTTRPARVSIHATSTRITPLPTVGVERFVAGHKQTLREGDPHATTAALVRVWPKDAPPCPYAPLLDLLRTGVALDAIADRDLVLVVPPVA